jgi:hypothetical protein
MGERNMSGRLANRMARSGHPRATLSEHMRLIGAKRMGRVQLQCRRALIALSRVRIGDLLVWAYPHVTEFKHWDRKSIHREKSAYQLERHASDAPQLGCCGRNMMQHGPIKTNEFSWLICVYG